MYIKNRRDSSFIKVYSSYQAHTILMLISFEIGKFNTLNVIDIEKNTRKHE